LLAHVVRLDRADQALDRCVGGQVGEVILHLAGDAPLAGQPELLPRAGGCRRAPPRRRPRGRVAPRTRRLTALWCPGAK
jgi:hypothetical protein